jgi:hypothetical protein
MTHVEQKHFGNPSKDGYHNTEWGTLMDAIGLTPSDTGEPGGKRTGKKVTHYIEPGGRFSEACAAFLASGQPLTLYSDQWRSEEDKAKARKKTASKTKYTCPGCDQNAWGKPDLLILCGVCELEFEADAGA